MKFYAVTNNVQCQELAATLQLRSSTVKDKNLALYERKSGN